MSWMLPTMMPGLLIAATFGLGRLETSLDQSFVDGDSSGTASRERRSPSSDRT